MDIVPHAEGLTVVNNVDIEEYLLGVVSSEMGKNYPPEALKAQAVAARTYAEKNLGHDNALGYDLDDTPGCQVYGGYFSEDPRTTQAVTDTCGMVMTYQAQLIDAVYSSNCGGITESAQEAWGKAIPYLVSVPDGPTEGRDPVITPANEQDWASYCKVIHNWYGLQPDYAHVESYRWITLLTQKELQAGLPPKYQVGDIMKMIPRHRGASGRITDLQLIGSTGAVDIMTESSIRNALGKLRSSAFTIDTFCDDTGKPVVFALWGAGWGHGIGMSQVGAVGLAKLGWTYQQILQHYYTGVKLEVR
jgi:SpoIID/LytB domain protein